MSKRGRPSDPPYLMWLCYHLACEVDVDSDFLPQQKTRYGLCFKVGAPAIVGKKLNLSPSTISRYALKARTLLKTDEGTREYIDWLNNRERAWWFFYADLTKRDVTLPMRLLKFDGDQPVPQLITGAELEAYVNEAKKLHAMNNRDFEEWKLVYERRNERHRFMPVAYSRLSESEPKAVEIDHARLAKNLPLTIRLVGTATREKLSTSHKVHNRDRDAKIREDRTSGVSLRELATKYKKSAARISQICSTN